MSSGPLRAAPAGRLLRDCGGRPRSSDRSSVGVGVVGLEDRGGDVSELGCLFGGELVEEMPADRSQVVWGGAFDGCSSKRREGDDRPASVVVARMSLDESSLLHPLEVVGQAAGRPAGRPCQVAESAPVVGGFREAREYFVVSI